MPYLLPCLPPRRSAHALADPRAPPAHDTLDERHPGGAGSGLPGAAACHACAPAPPGRPRTDLPPRPAPPGGLLLGPPRVRGTAPRPALWPAHAEPGGGPAGPDRFDPITSVVGESPGSSAAPPYRGVLATGHRPGRTAAHEWRGVRRHCGPPRRPGLEPPAGTPPGLAARPPGAWRAADTHPHLVAGTCQPAPGSGCP